MAVRVVLVDDYPVVRRGMLGLIEQHGGASVVGQAGDGATALSLVRSTSPDVVVVDVHLPDRNGVALVVQFMCEFPALKVILISEDNTVSLIRGALEAGVHAYLLKTSAEDELTRAIRAVMDGRLYLCPEVRHLLDQEAKPAPKFLSS